MARGSPVLAALLVASLGCESRSPRASGESGPGERARSRLAVRVRASSPGIEVRCTTDGSDPSLASPVCTGELTLAETSLVKARGFHRGRAVSAVAEATFRRVEPRPATPVPDSLPGLLCERYAGEWTSLPDFDAFEPTGTRTASEVGLPAGAREERVALRFTGFVEVPRDDVYVFEAASDDGSRVWVDGELVVDNDGPHATEARRGRIALAAGTHPIVVGWFNRTGGAELSLRMATLGSLPETARRFVHARGEARR